MMKKFKRTLSILLIFCMLFSLVPAVGAQSDDGIAFEKANRPEGAADLRQSRRGRKRQSRFLFAMISKAPCYISDFRRSIHAARSAKNCRFSSDTRGFCARSA